MLVLAGVAGATAQMNDIDYRVANPAHGHEHAKFGFPPSSNHFEVYSPAIR